MKAQLETIHYTKSQSSFHFFKREEAFFHSYRHYHPELELTFIERGNGIRYVGDNIASYEAGDLILFGKNLPHDYVSFPSEKSMGSIAYVFQFPETLLQNVVEGHSLLDWFSYAKRGIHFSQLNAVIIKKIKSISFQPSLKNFIRFLEILNELQKHPHQKLISSIAFSDTNNNRKAQNKISIVTKYISENYQEKIPANQVAALSNMTLSSFCRWFKQKTGRSFVTYLNATRIEKACQLLLQTEHPIAFIGFQTGFETISHFNRTFKSLKGCTPKEYRAQFKS